MITVSDKINKLLIKAQKEPNLDDAMIYLMKWHKRIQKGNKKGIKPTLPPISKTEIQKPSLLVPNFDNEVCFIIDEFLEATNLKDLRDLTTKGVLTYLSIKDFGNTSEHQKHLINLQELSILLSKLEDLQKFFRQDKPSQYLQALGDL